VTVQDTGRGIAASQLPRLFDLYEQDGTDKGLGLGLYIVKRLTELQRGTVTAESEGEGKGASFTVALPRV
jgi:signal transduction histidine kinase